MLIISSPSDLAGALSASLPAAVRKVLALRADLIDLATFAIPTIGDNMAVIERAAGVQIATDAENDTRYGEPDFMPSFEWVMDHGGAYEAPFILSDDGTGVVLLVPDDQRIDPTLLSIMRAYAEPAANGDMAGHKQGDAFKA